MMNEHWARIVLSLVILSIVLFGNFPNEDIQVLKSKNEVGRGMEKFEISDKFKCNADGKGTSLFKKYIP